MHIFRNFEDELNPIGKTIWAALDQSQEPANTYSPVRMKLAVMFGPGGEQCRDQRATNTVPAKLKRYRG